MNKIPEIYEVKVKTSIFNTLIHPFVGKENAIDFGRKMLRLGKTVTVTKVSKK